MEQVSDAIVERAAIKKIRRGVLPLLIGGYFFAYLDRVNIGFAALTMNADLRLNSSVFGLTAGIFFLGYVLFEVPSNLILHRVGARWWLARVMMSWGIISTATAFAWNAGSLITARFLLGLAEAGYFPGVIFFLMSWLPNEYRARFIGSLLAVAALSIIIGSPMSGWIMSLGSIAGLHSWQWLFIIEGLPSVAIGIFVLIFLPEDPKHVTWLTAAEKDWLARRLAAEQADKEGLQTYRLRDVFLSANVWLLGFAIFPIGAATYGLLSWLPQILQGLGLTNIQTGLVSAAPLVITIPVMLFWSARSDRTRERSWHIFLPATWGSAGLAVAALWPPGIVSFAGIVLGISGVFSSLAILFTVAPALLNGIAAAAGTALITSVGNIGSFAGPYLIGWITGQGGSNQISLLVLAAMMAGTGVLGLALRLPAAWDG